MVSRESDQRREENKDRVCDEDYVLIIFYFSIWPVQHVAYQVKNGKVVRQHIYNKQLENEQKVAMILPVITGRRFVYPKRNHNNKDGEAENNFKDKILL